MQQKLKSSFFKKDVLKVAPALIGKILVRQYENGIVERFRITETEAYRGEEDLACHVSKGRTMRTEIMFGPGGHVYVYLIYGMYWMLNFVTGEKENGQAVLVRGMEGYNGPGKLTKKLNIDKTFYGENLETSSRIWVEKDCKKFNYKTGVRVGIDYAGEIWKNKPWRFMITG
ncbi:MAG: DNA-3-methyladenine glycosylase [bacterium]